MKDNTETSPDIVRTRFSSKGNQTTLNIELGLVTKKSINAASPAGSASAAGTGGAGVVAGIVGGEIPDGACFFGDTVIGEDVFIEDAKIGTLTKCFHNGSIVDGEILDVMVHEVEKVEVFIIAKRLFLVTEEHKFWDGEAYTPIGNFQVGDTVNGKEVEARTDMYGKFKVYNITTQYGNYFANGMLVSNRKRDPTDGGTFN